MSTCIHLCVLLCMIKEDVFEMGYVLTCVAMRLGMCVYSIVILLYVVM